MVDVFIACFLRLKSWMGRVAKYQIIPEMLTATAPMIHPVNGISLSLGNSKIPMRKCVTIMKINPTGYKNQTQRSICTSDLLSKGNMPRKMCRIKPARKSEWVSKKTKDNK